MEQYLLTIDTDKMAASGKSKSDLNNLFTDANAYGCTVEKYQAECECAAEYVIKMAAYEEQIQTLENKLKAVEPYRDIMAAADKLAEDFSKDIKAKAEYLTNAFKALSGGLNEIVGKVNEVNAEKVEE